MPAWKKASKPLYTTGKYLHSMADAAHSVVIIDIRPESAVTAGHIPGSTAVTMADLANRQEAFPKKKNAPIAIVSDKEDEALQAFATIRGWGYKNATILQGGIDSWLTAKLPVATGPAASAIVYVPKPIPGAMDAAEFEKLLAGGAGDTIIIDVRTEEEAESGSIAGAINIPADEITDRLDEIPKDKQVVTFCSTGIRAEMAFVALKDKGYGAKFLNAKTDFSEGKPSISEN